MNKSLPTRWTLQHGAYYYRVPLGMEQIWDGKKMFRLGKSLPEAFRKWGEMAQKPLQAVKVNQLLDRYALEVIPTKRIRTQATNIHYLGFLRTVFGDMYIEDLTPRMVYQYIDKRSQKYFNPETKRMIGGRATAILEATLFSHVYTKAIEWGYIERHPFKGQISVTGNKPRSRLIEDWEITECLRLNAQRKKGSILAIQAYIRLKLITGMSQYDLLSLREQSIKEDGIHVRRHKTADKTGKSTIYRWNEDLKFAVELARQARTAKSDYLFCSRSGGSYINPNTDDAPGWKSMWRNFMQRVLKETNVIERFTEHDLRAKCASDADSLEHARALLSHANSAITNRVYRRGAEIVEPLKSKFPPTPEPINDTDEAL